MPDLIGQSISRYHILEQLGEGGMAYNDGFVEFNGLNPFHSTYPCS